MELRDRIAVVTGGASGIGAASVELLRQKGARPVVWDMTETDGLRCDVSDPASVKAAMAWTVERYGRPTLLVAAAGLGGAGGRIVDIEPAEWDRMFAVNARGTMLSVQAVAREAIAAGTGGSMVLISSIHGTLTYESLCAYAATKAAINQIAKIAARELGPNGIRVNAIGPGPTETPMLGHRLEKPGYRESVLARTPLREFGTARYIAQSIVGLMEMDWITGQMILADGGCSLTGSAS